MVGQRGADVSIADEGDLHGAAPFDLVSKRTFVHEGERTGAINSAAACRYRSSISVLDESQGGLFNGGRFLFRLNEFIDVIKNLADLIFAALFLLGDQK